MISIGIVGYIGKERKYNVNFVFCPRQKKVVMIREFWMEVEGRERKNCQIAWNNLIISVGRGKGILYVRQDYSLGEEKKKENE